MSTDNTNKRYFAIEAAAIALQALAAPGSIERELEAAGIVCDADHAVHYLKSQGITSQGHFAAIVINLTHGEGLPLDPADLTKTLAQAYPNAGVGKRHGPHYICHARKGRLTGLKADMAAIPYARRTKSTSPASDADQQVDAQVGNEPVTAETLTEENTKATLVDMCKAMGLDATGNKTVLAERLAQALNPSEAPVQEEAAA